MLFYYQKIEDLFKIIYIWSIISHLRQCWLKQTLKFEPIGNFFLPKFSVTQIYYNSVHRKKLLTVAGPAVNLAVICEPVLGRGKWLKMELLPLK